MKWNIARALKEKTRIINKINVIDALIKEENSMEEGIERSCDIRSSIEQKMQLMNFLICLKSKIAIANAGIADKLNRLSELKGLIGFYRSLNCREGSFSNRYDGNGEKTIITAIISKKEVTQKVEEIQAEIDKLQDEIDDFNATTLIEVEV